MADHVRLAFPLPAGAGRPGEDAAPPVALLSLAAAGDMRYVEAVENPRRTAFFRAIGIDPAKVLGTELRHTRRVLVRQKNGERVFGPVRTGDAVRGSYDGILAEDGFAASITVADCMPIWIWDPHSGVFGVLHSGWKGTGILAVAVRALEELYGSPPGGISVILGPAIGTCCYPVPRERAEGFALEFGPDAVAESDGLPRLDLRAANIGMAKKLGLGALLSLDACTSCDPRLGSFRREGPTSFTRMVALAAGPSVFAVDGSPSPSGAIGVGLVPGVDPR
jgi:hypothetical protein